ncbi:hypothetical protein K491DRAFT_568492, partial [Lophiostoma macrostomum CBS 122681]
LRGTTWKSGIRAGLYSSITVLTINIFVLLVGCFAHNGYKDGIGTIAIGTPRKVQMISTAFHVLINIMSSILLISSNYAMQILCAPTRDDLDRAHSQNKWLDIGLVSLHNLGYIPRKRVVLFWILACSSVPLHVFYNSAIFSVTAGHDYEVSIVYPSSAPPNWTRFENAHWPALYDTQFVAGYGNLALVVTDTSF